MGDEARKFLRYVMPGLVYGIETLLFLYIVMPEFTICVLAKLTNKNALGFSVNAFLASGALGYIFAAVHHLATLHCEKRILDQREIVKKLITEDLIELDNKTPTLSHLDEDTQEARQRAESISLSKWISHLTDKHKLGTDAVDSLKTQAHGLGTTRIASVFALVTTILLSWRYGTLDVCHVSPFLRYLLMLVLGCFATCVFHYNYQRVLQFAQDAFNDTLNMLLKDYEETH